MSYWPVRRGEGEGEFQPYSQEDTSRSEQDISYTSVDPMVTEDMIGQRTLDNSSPPKSTFKDDNALVDGYELGSQETPRKSDSITTSKWTIGWKIPSLIIGFYFLALAIGIAHLVLFHWLDGQKVTQTIPQSYVAAISTAMVTAFRIFLVTSLVISFTQLVWQRLRGRPMKVLTIDSLFSITSNPFNFVYPDVLASAPLLCLCAAVCWCVPVAMIYPPGALTVEPRSFLQTVNMSVPTFDPTFRGNGTLADLERHALYKFDDFMNYENPKIKLSRLGIQTIVSGNYQTSSSPCGQNCSYTLEVTGPGFKCEDRIYSDLQSLVNDTVYGTYSYDITDGAIYLAGENSSDSVNSDDMFYRFELQWRDTGVGQAQNLSCLLHEASYKMNVSYLDGVQTVAVKSHIGKVLDSTDIYNDFALLPNTTKEYESYEFMVTNSTIGESGTNIADLFKRCNILAVKDTLVDGLSGLVGQNVMHSQPVYKTLIQESSLATAPLLSQSDPTFNISAKTLQSLLLNITISMLTLNQTHTPAAVQTTTFDNVFAFTHPLNLILPYFLCLAAALIFVIAGGIALLRNGVPASSNSFLQLLCTTRGSERLDKAAAGGCLGGPDNVPEELGKLRVRFGELVQRDGDGMVQRDSEGMVVRRAGFGTVDEVAPLKRSRTYGLG
ncbi:MAG: hypothetical protein M1834_005909 [Cirrosporium novae-zelandiae]|nr:MAG: hypothetical protein M1834_005909 [Cirrosporium novae-zelandiae]